MSSNSARDSLPKESTMPIELAMPLYLSSDEFLNPRASKYSRPLRPCLNQCQSSKLSFSSLKEQSEFNGVSGALMIPGRAKKQVSFADHKGLSLTVVKIFSEFDDPIDIPDNIANFFTSSLTVSEGKDKLTLDFDQPSADYLKFRQRIENDHVCLEHCMLKEKSIMGTVKVKNISFEKSVKLRITFDTWKNHTDVQCQYVKDTYTASNRDTFSFEASLPEQVPSHERIEFAICYEVNGDTLWDNNQGKNYRIIQSALRKSSNESNGGHQQYSLSDWDIHFDRYGSPRCSRGIFPHWPSYVGYEDIGPYY
ncbi:protein phosphatase 1 regulatory subunit 3B isoform X1 [Danio aesculapii]|uniref:protein phosphatase 1 regulatory subunit 3B isoform X1 n=2 Tax=Danio aesculapii TaxID=1142201 RepID=UPI0024C0D573|nr:protein phosphatase 1 regulatory subunit 3B isoform X1 [Danio aesculapii]XP_056302299.1 protein phosphatase 1 regulatory subunit 3B isoform X1 [Danio aesculapii]